MDNRDNPANEATVRYRESTQDLLEQCLERVRAECPVERPGQLRAHVPSIEPASQKLILIELIKFDMAMAAEIGCRRDLDFYLNEFEDWLPAADVPVDLVLEEAQLFREMGGEPDWQEYGRRFPHLANALTKFALPSSATARSDLSLSKPPEIKVGGQIDDFHILLQLGQGAFARVYLARQESMQRLVALKVSTRGSDESHSLSRLDHLNIVRVYDQRNQENPPMRLLYMQFVPGGTLADCIKLARKKSPESWSGKLIVTSMDENLLRAGQTTPEYSESRKLLERSDWPTVVAWIGTQLAEGLGYAHRCGVIHRDVKPANILLSSEGVPKLADFNVSYSGLAGRAGAAIYFGGSLAYMSPEQLQVASPAEAKPADELDGRSDLYSLAVVLWELCHGQRPWADDSIPESWSAALEAEYVSRQQPLPKAASETSPTRRVLDRALRWTLAIKPDDRPQTGEELAGALRLALYPLAAARFLPDPQNWWTRVSQLPVWQVLAVLTFPPIIAAAIFNYVYNRSQIVEHFPELWARFETLSFYVNGFAFPAGAAFFLWFVGYLQSALRAADSKRLVERRGLDAAWILGHQVALICGSLWLLAGLTFPIALTMMYQAFPIADAAHFFVSLLICGGVAMIYPFFGVTLMTLMHHYPRLIARSMQDAQFERHAVRLRQRSRVYLAAAVAIPLLALTLLVLRSNVPREILLATIFTTALGAVAAYIAVQKIDQIIGQLGQVLAPRQTLEHVLK